MAVDATSVFPVGYYLFHKDETFNYQLNRWHSLGLLPYEDLKDIGPRIKTFSDWVAAMVDLAGQAEAEGRLLNAAFTIALRNFIRWREMIPAKSTTMTDFPNCSTKLSKETDLSESRSLITERL